MTISGLTTNRIGLCITNSLAVFTAISFITSMTTVTPQIMLPLVGELAPPNRRGAALSIVVSGFMLGLLIARVLSGTVTEYTSWRNVYWLALGLQYLIFVLLWLFMPDYPSTNPDMRSFWAYLHMLWSIVMMLFQYPVLLQACLIGFFTTAPFTCFWTTLTFLLAGPPYEYSSLVIGLFALIGIGAMCTMPFFGRLIIDRFAPLWSVVLGEALTILGVCLGTYLGTFTVAGPILEAFLLDIGIQTAQIANRSAIYAILPKARNRVNTAFMVFTFCGQLTGTAVGNRLYAEGGWIASGSYSVASVGGALLVCLARGPWEERWFGWKGGWGFSRAVKDENKEAVREKDHLKAVEGSSEKIGDAVVIAEQGGAAVVGSEETSIQKLSKA